MAITVLALQSCEALKNQNQDGSQRLSGNKTLKNGAVYGVNSATEDGGHPSDSGASGRGFSLFGGGNSKVSGIKTSNSPFINDASKVWVVLPKDRCKSGYITFGPHDGKYYKCEALGRGITRWTSGNPALSKSSSENTVVYNGRRRTAASDWAGGTTSSGQRCWVYNSNKTGGKTPVTTFSLAGRSGSHNDWAYREKVGKPGNYANYGVALSDSVSGRGSFAVHSDNRFGSYPDLEQPTHSSAGCVKLKPECMDVFQDFADQHKGMSMVVREE